MCFTWLAQNHLQTFNYASIQHVWIEYLAKVSMLCLARILNATQVPSLTNASSSDEQRASKRRGDSSASIYFMIKKFKTYALLIEEQVRYLSITLLLHRGQNFLSKPNYFLYSIWNEKYFPLEHISSMRN